MSGFSLSSSGLDTDSASAFVLLKAKMSVGQAATVFINADSTGYSDYGPFYKFAVALGDLHDYTVVLYRWAEWDGSAATGPKQYASPVTLRTGTRGTLTVYLAALPGQVAGCMFDGGRESNAIDAIPTPDLCITHHGHNMQSFNIPSGTSNYATGAGLFLGPIGMAELQWPNVPQIITTQSPWRDDTGYTKVYQAILLACVAHPTMTMIDTYAQFIARGKASSLYRDNVHPSDTSANSAGAQLIADTLLGAYKSARSSVYTTPAWPLQSAPNLIDNGDFLTWPGTPPTPPTGWTLAGSGTSCAKDTDVKYGEAAYSMAIIPSTSVVGQNTYLQKYLSSAEMARIAGKTVNVAMLVRGRSTQPRAYASFGVPDFSNAIKTYVMGDLLNCKDGWMWLVACGIPVVNDPAATWKYLRICPAFDVVNPANTDPLNIQKVLITEGLPPRGVIGS
ncbi:SGNH/GDSL hydrolase family protein [Agrobacterium tumefaciens]|uniref:SGNH/GDSL hydrolase family protein n=1 Tax=Agrobacterium tumefaciens TaxID=358 RepID=UPI001572AAD3|nr:SGNH/GDSL hydrolase family protein [Agrobacterium tumefaciens]NSX84480.1 SGNH/GDSL hydrolase family protein [Agrobacterium tumefaciens]